MPHRPPSEVRWIVETASALASLVAACETEDKQRAVDALGQLLAAATRYAGALREPEPPYRPDDAALVRAVERLSFGWRQP